MEEKGLPSSSLKGREVAKIDPTCICICKDVNFR